MLITLILACVFARPPQQLPTPVLPPDHLVALVFSDTDTQRMRLDDAEAAYAALEVQKVTTTLSDGDARLHAALTLALGTLPDVQRLSVPLLVTRERLDWEVRRGVRLPVQRKGH